MFCKKGYKTHDIGLMM